MKFLQSLVNGIKQKSDLMTSPKPLNPNYQNYLKKIFVIYLELLILIKVVKSILMK